MEDYLQYLEESITSENTKLDILTRFSPHYSRFQASYALNTLKTSIDKLIYYYKSKYSQEEKKFNDIISSKQEEYDKIINEKQVEIDEEKSKARGKYDQEVTTIKEELNITFNSKEEEREELQNKLDVLKVKYNDLYTKKNQIEVEHDSKIKQLLANGKAELKQIEEDLKYHLYQKLYYLYKERNELHLTEEVTNFDNLLFYDDNNVCEWLENKENTLLTKSELEQKDTKDYIYKMVNDNRNEFNSFTKKLLDLSIEHLNHEISNQDNEISYLMDNIRNCEKTIDFNNNRHNELTLKSEKLAIKAVNYEKYFAEERRKRRDLACELMNLKGNIRVYCRVRPILPYEVKQYEETGRVGFSDCISYPVPGEMCVRKDVESCPDHYEFDQLFKPDSTQEDVFYEVYPYIQKLLDGYNVCIFAYGQTGSGKTFTMEGPGNDPGVNYRAIQTLFDISESKSDIYKYTFEISALEIYNEHIYDILVDRKDKHKSYDDSDSDNDSSTVFNGLHKLKIRTTPDGGAYVEDLTTVQIVNFSQAKTILQQGHKRRFEASHKLNDHSSRSHLIVTISFGAVHNNGSQIYGKLHLIDLAGSERVSKTEANGARLTEAKNINKSLACLGNVIKAIGETNVTHIPYRESKLTHILKDSLNGNSKVLMFVNVTPAHYNVLETISSVQFATRCRKTEIGFAQQNVAQTVNEQGKASITMTSRGSIKPKK